MRTWTEDRIETLRRMLRAGEPYSAIAEALPGISRNAVIGKASRLGLSGIAPRARRGSVGRPRQGERAEAGDAAAPWSEEEVEALRRLAFRRTAGEIARELGRTACAVRDKARRLGLVLKPGERCPPGTGVRKASAPAVPMPSPKAPAGPPPVEVASAAAVRFIDRRAFQCAAILDPGVQILERMVCGRRVSGLTSWCAEHRRLYLTRRVAA